MLPQDTGRDWCLSCPSETLLHSPSTLFLWDILKTYAFFKHGCILHVYKPDYLISELSEKYKYLPMKLLQNMYYKMCTFQLYILFMMNGTWQLYHIVVCQTDIEYWIHYCPFLQRYINTYGFSSNNFTLCLCLNIIQCLYLPVDQVKRRALAQYY